MTREDSPQRTRSAQRKEGQGTGEAGGSWLVARGGTGDRRREKLVVRGRMRERDRKCRGARPCALRAIPAEAGIQVSRCYPLAPCGRDKSEGD